MLPGVFFTEPFLNQFENDGQFYCKGNKKKIKYGKINFWHAPQTCTLTGLSYIPKTAGKNSSNSTKNKKSYLSAI